MSQTPEQIAASIDWIPTCLPGQERVTIVEQILRATTSGETITVPRPHVPYGPGGMDRDEADARYLREAARSLADFYRPFGSNLRATIVKLLNDAADEIAKGQP